jgi:hypothetical protein
LLKKRTIAKTPTTSNPNRQTPSITTDVPIRNGSTFCYPSPPVTALTAQRPKAIPKMTAKIVASFARLIGSFEVEGSGSMLIQNS